MHPAFSVIFLTTLIGVGQGLFLALFTGEVYALAHLLPAQDSRSFYAAGSLLALAFLLAGLVASFFHLGHPERAWRAASQWRTSWLSREVIVLPIVMALVFLYGMIHWFGWTEPLFVISGALPVDLSLIVGLLASIAAFALFVCTGMIYAAIKFLQEWHTALTVVNYTVLGIASGFTLAAGFSAWMGADLVLFYGTWAVIFTALGFVTRLAAIARNAKLRPKSSLQSAIGVRHGKIVQKAQGFMGGSFNTREYVHGRSPGFLRGIMWWFLVLVFLVPLALLGASYGIASETLPLLAFFIQYIGLIGERWHFFADARHPQNLYYQSMA
ncbi:MAG: sulfite dehydrogenase subunit SoeC [Gammaproteobacteria bacterium]